MEQAQGIFEGKIDKKPASLDEEKDQLYTKIGRLQTENDFLKRVLDHNE